MTLSTGVGCRLTALVVDSPGADACLEAVGPHGVATERARQLAEVLYAPLHMRGIGIRHNRGTARCLSQAPALHAGAAVLLDAWQVRTRCAWKTQDPAPPQRTVNEADQGSVVLARCMAGQIRLNLGQAESACGCVRMACDLPWVGYHADGQSAGSNSPCGGRRRRETRRRPGARARQHEA
jgi:hypothetical protein